MKAVILAGGYGKRLRPLTDTTPKPLLIVGGKPILEWQILWLRQYGVDSFVVTASYLAEKITQYLGDGEKWGIESKVVVEEEPLGRGGALKNVEKLLEGEKEFIMTNGDVITNLDVSKLTLGGYVASLALTPLQSPYGIINVDGSKVTSFVEKPTLKDYWINAGVYRMTPKIFEYLPRKGDIEDTAFQELVKKDLLGGFKFDGCYWRSTDSIKDMEEVNRDLSEKKVF
ncbi:MAG: nucleotidyltransferase family protein [Candidatus Micrarchaeota archaeon]|nr:nucleotidyltransferase family protein [Candidatus Micrarchaeota archaeon]MDE1848136.1 nucleotidyltransferase family protein [Candidatus Micrarchaeota archaeon]MDE1864791.1 nucleotidyltransferase family protein [Candidatus Micrarchaeota archaeon]